MLPWEVCKDGNVPAVAASNLQPVIKLATDQTGHAGAHLLLSFRG